MNLLKNISFNLTSNLTSLREGRLFFISFMLLAIPLFYLSYEFNKSNEEGIIFAESENKGLSSLLTHATQYISLRNDFVDKHFHDGAHLVWSQVANLDLERDHLLDESNLILDPQKETYHLIVASQKYSYEIEKEIFNLHYFYSHGTQGKSSDSLFSSDFIKNKISDTITSYKKYCSKDCPSQFTSSYEEYKSSLSQVLLAIVKPSLHSSQNKALEKDLKYFLQTSDNLRLLSNTLISQKLNQRIDHYKFRRKSVLGGTFIIWFISILCSYIYYSINLREIKNYISRIQDQTEELEKTKKLSFLGELAAGIGHEVSTPLSIIQLSLELINRNLETKGINAPTGDQDISSLLARIEKMTLNIRQILQSFRSFAYNVDDESISNVSLIEAINDSLLLIHHKALKENVKIEKLFNDDVRVLGTIHGIGQVLVILLNNAIEALEHVDQKRVTIEVKLDGNYALIDVTDNGPGVSLKIREKIFKPLFTTKTSTGLGLGLAKKICLKCEGDLLLLESQQGARFRIKLKIP